MLLQRGWQLRKVITSKGRDHGGVEGKHYVRERVAALDWQENTTSPATAAIACNAAALVADPAPLSHL